MRATRNASTCKSAMGERIKRNIGSLASCMRTDNDMADEKCALYFHDAIVPFFIEEMFTFIGYNASLNLRKTS